MPADPAEVSREDAAEYARLMADRIEGKQLNSAQQRFVDRVLRRAEQKSSRKPTMDEVGAAFESAFGPASGPTKAEVPGARRDTGWGEAVIKTGTDALHGFKALVPTGSVTVPSLTAGVVQVPDRPRSLLQVIPAEPLQGTDQFSFLRETARTHNAAPVAVGALKPTSVYSVERVDDRVRTVAHLSEPIPRQTLADAPLLRAYVEGSLREGVELAVENQILNGSGVGENMTGIANTPGQQVQAFDTDIIRTCRRAITLMENNNIVPSFFILNPTDWETIELFREDGATGGFLLRDEGPPVDRARRRLWAVPVVVTTAQAAGTGYLVNVGSVTFRERETVAVSWSENVGTDYQSNMIRWRAEGRWGFAVTRVSGAIEIDTAAA